MVDYGFVRFMTSGYITQEELSWLQTFTVEQQDLTVLENYSNSSGSTLSFM